jgi:hypothetical protein
MSGNFKIRYTLPLSSGSAICNKLESYLNSAATLDISSSTALPNLSFQRALHKQGVYSFNTQTVGATQDASGSIVVFDLSGKGIRVRLVDNSGNVTGTKYLDLSNGATGSSTF